MKTKNLFTTLLLLSWHLCSLAQSNKINGVSFVASGIKIDATHTAPVVQSKSNAVALMPFGFIRKLASPKIIHNTERQWFGETKAGLIQYAQQFRKHQIKIMVKPQIWVWNGAFTGKIEMNNEADWKRLEASYTAFILTYAEAAKEINAELLCIGTELEKFVTKRPEYWQNLIKEIRKIYKGKLTYAANWDEYKRVPFWADLDFIGIDAYFPVSDAKTPSVADFEKGWQPHKNGIIQLHNQYQKPVLFTEYGYRSVDFSGKKPWDSTRVQGNVNHTAQTNGLQAIYNQFWKEEWFAGGFVWKWFHKHNEVGGLENNRFTPQNKPAETLLRQLYGVH